MSINYLDRVANARSVPEASDAYLSALREHGFQHGLYIARFLLSLPAAVLREEPILFGNFPDGFVARLGAGGLLATAPWAVWALQNSGNASLRDACLGHEDGAAEIHPAIRLAMDHGVEAGRVISLKNRVPRSHGAVLLCPGGGISHERAETAWQSARGEIGILTSVLHLRLATLGRRLVETRLTQRQREVLEWSSAGKTVAEIGTILGVAAATVEKHLRLARQAIGADTTAHAILRAHLAHQIFPHGQDLNPFT